jgi:hypothetical protein
VEQQHLRFQNGPELYEADPFLVAHPLRSLVKELGPSVPWCAEIDD